MKERIKDFFFKKLIFGLGKKKGKDMYYFLERTFLGKKRFWDQNMNLENFLGVKKNFGKLLGSKYNFVKILGSKYNFGKWNKNFLF